MSRVFNPNDGGDDDPPPDPPPVGEEDPAPSGQSLHALTLAEPGRPIPILYGTRKVTALLLEKTAPSTAVSARRAALTDYQEGQFVTVLAYVVEGARSQDALFRCEASGTTSALADFSGVAFIAIGDTYSDGTCDWKLISIGGATVKVTTQQALLGICEGEAQGALQMWWDKERVASGLGLTSPGRTLTIQLGPDDLSQAVPAAFAGDDFDYQHTAIVYGAEIPTGTEKEIPSLAFEMQGVMFGVATRDVSPADIINDLLTHSRRGCEWPSGRVDSSITGSGAGGYRVYCDAFGLRLSMLIDSQRPALSLIADVLAATNSDAIWSQGKLKVVPLGDVANASPIYGATGYVPANTSQFAIGVDNFRGPDMPVRMRRDPDADCFNSFPVEYIDTTNGSYARITLEDPDMSDVDVRGLRRAPTVVLPFAFPGGEAPVMLSRIYAQRSLNCRNTYSFRLPWNYIGLEPTDIVTLTDPELGLAATPVRIVSITEGEDFTLDIVARDYPASVQGATRYTPQAGDGYESNDRTTGASLPLAVDEANMTMGAAVVGAAALAAASACGANLSLSNFQNLWPNGTSEASPPDGADLTQPEWANRYVLGDQWAALTVYAANAVRLNGGGPYGGTAYICTTGGTSAAAGGPSGTGTGIVDGTVVWDYLFDLAETPFGGGGPYAGNFVRRINGNGTTFTMRLPAIPGEVYKLSSFVRAFTTGANLGGSVQVMARDKNLAYLSDTASAANDTATWTLLSATHTMPADTVWVDLILRSSGSASAIAYFDTISGQRLSDASAVAPSGTQYQVLTTVGGVSTWADGSKKVLTTTGDLLHASAANTPARLAIGTTDQELVVASGLPSWYSGAKKLLDATGAMLYASAANTLAKLGIGSAGQVLGISGGLPAWQTPAAGGSVPWNMSELPSSPDSRDEEFEGTAFSGWTDIGTRSATAIDPYAQFNTANVWRHSWNTMRRSWFLIQPTYAGSNTGIQKSITVNTNDLVYCVIRADFPLWQPSNATDARVSLVLSDNTSFSNYTMASVNLSSATTPMVGILSSSGGSQLRTLTFGTITPQIAMALLMHKVGTRYYAWISLNGTSWSPVGGSVTHATTFGVISLLVSTGSTPTTNDGNPIVGVDFIRFKNTATDLP